MKSATTPPILQLNAQTGLLEGDVTHLPSPNYNDRPEGLPIDMIVVHCISLPPGEFGGPHVGEFFQNRLDPGAHPYFKTIHELQVSAHCFVDRAGAVTQFVPFHCRAWHAGESHFEGQSNCNDFSVGVELEGLPGTPFEDSQYITLERLCGLLMTQYPGINPHRIVGHEHIAPGRKDDPGPTFAWAPFRKRLAQV